MTVPTKTLPSGAELPALGLGTYDLSDGETADSVRAALDAGYAHIDTAEGYMNEAAVGDALAASGVDRDDVFLTSKVLAKNLNYESVIESCEASLDRLGTDYLDLYLIHWPNPAISLRETLRAMAELRERGLVRDVGVSNFSAYQLSCAHHISDVPIAVNQIEFHPWFQRPDLVDYCRETDTVVEAAAPLARTDVFGDEVVADLAEKYDKHPAQVVVRWAIDSGVVPLPRSSTPEHVRANADLDWELDEADRRRLDERDRDAPVYDTPARDWTSDVYGIEQ
ncbi:aldo/keto reductase [Halorubrum distributum JCM 9100]|uniref:Aldo/keto reductase n=5 Tax=Halorubrum distributum TaxID=29283 RepID=M0ERV3_9EURY|nr:MULTISPECIES: aldo/keto reductase [Halorubrum distributum group]ELZ31857.1 aldo/keto reductase [Halorubrum terrestre JCM 10247]ELZ49149.1 aldo/keto reductase [Halorubrum distributum JCM 9100]ELZ57789.1 aldo/keto reductase [Halorubrum distributum JCM 10118]EMA59990.1 aldo/keto reductase [Halorubrum litoreum JCM 13561]MDV7350455.1 aldo/keto reductase [Halorubrum distributum]